MENVTEWLIAVWVFVLTVNVVILTLQLRRAWAEANAWRKAYQLLRRRAKW